MADPDTDARHADETRLVLTALARRCRKVAELCDKAVFDRAPEARTYLIAQFGHAVMLGLCHVAGAELRGKFFGWLAARYREDIGCCPWCGKQKAALPAPMCDDCLKEVEAMDQELALDELLLAPAKSDGRPPAPQDPRD